MKRSNRGKGIHRNPRFEDDGVYHPYRRPGEDIYEASSSTSGGPPIAHMPIRTQSTPLIQDSVPPRAHSMILPQQQGPYHSQASIGLPHHGYSGRTPPPPVAVSTHRMHFEEPSRGSFRASSLPAIEAPPPSRELYEQEPIRGSFRASSLPAIEAPPPSRELYEQAIPSSSAVNYALQDSNVTVGEVQELITLFNKQYSRPGSLGSSSGHPIAASDADALISLFNKLQRNRQRPTSTITSGNIENVNTTATDLAAGQNRGVILYASQPSTSSQPAVSTYDDQHLYMPGPSTSHQPSIITEPIEYVDDDECSVEGEPPNIQTPQREDSSTQQSADVFGNYLASCLKDMKGQARVDAEKQIFDCLNNLRKTAVKEEAGHVDSSPDPVIVNEPPVQQLPAAPPLMISEVDEPDYEPFPSPTPMPQPPRSVQLPWTQQTFGPQQFMQQLQQQQWQQQQWQQQQWQQQPWQQQQNMPVPNIAQSTMNAIYNQMNVESLMMAQTTRTRPSQQASNPMQRLLRQQFPMGRLPQDFFNQSPDFNPLTDLDWDHMF